MSTLFRRFPRISSFVLSAILFISSPIPSKGAGLVGCDEQDPTSCSLCGLFTTVKNVYDFISRLVIVLAVAYTLWGGYEIMISGANPKLYASGRKRIKNAFLGVFIVLAAWFLVNAFIVGLTGGGDIYGAPWKTLQCQ